MIEFEEVPSDLGIQGTVHLADHGGKPRLVIEVTSPSTRNTDLNNKVDEYYRCRIEQYVIVDVGKVEGERTLEIIPYQRGSEGYVRDDLDEEGRIWLNYPRAWLGIKGRRAVCYDGDTGEEILDFQGQLDARQAAEEQAEAESAARQAAEERAEAESAARLAAEERIRELEKKMREIEGR